MRCRGLGSSRHIVIYRQGLPAVGCATEHGIGRLDTQLTATPHPVARTQERAIQATAAAAQQQAAKKFT